MTETLDPMADEVDQDGVQVSPTSRLLRLAEHTPQQTEQFAHHRAGQTDGRR
ncbi:hypothetical protein [Rhodococcus sp. IEGM1428]|uniref:hypothetical protein n=1 Tax=Rhodococcus sp. IEGM1428 TaxID=3392191 RepID=UPI003D0C70A4